MTTILDLLEDSAGGPGIIHFLPDDPGPFAQLWAESTDAAGVIARLAGTSGAVGALLTNSRAAVRAALGVWLSGNTLVSLPTRAPRQQATAWRNLISRMCGLGGIEVVLVPGDMLGDLADSGHTVIGQEALTGTAGVPSTSGGPGDLVQFTSGSASNPKGVVLNGTALARNVLAIRDAIDLGDGDLTVSWLPLSHDMGLVGMLLTPLAAAAPRFRGKGAVIMRPEYFVRDPTRWLSTCGQLAATVTTVPNFAFDLATRSRSRHDRLDLSALRICVTGAERVRAQSVRSFVSAFADAGMSDETICPAYGMAENGLAVTFVRPEERWHAVTVESADPAGSIEVVSTGRPLDGIKVRTQPSHEQIGEIEFTSPSLLDGYLGAEVPWTEDGWFRTRDSGFVRDGELFVLGRHDDTIVLDGRNVYPEDIEDAVDTLDIRPNSVAAVPWGDRGVAIVAEVRRSGHDLGLAANSILESVTHRTGVVVSALYFVNRGSLARTSSGKLQRKKVASLLRSGKLDLLGKFGKDA